jgi:hypothetical protein
MTRLGVSRGYRCNHNPKRKLTRRVGIIPRKIGHDALLGGSRRIAFALGVTAGLQIDEQVDDFIGRECI